MSNIIRVSCGALCRISNGYGEWLLGLNRNNLQKGKRVLKPIGGALRYYAPDLLRRWQAEPEVADEPDLRLYMDERYLPDFKAWFKQRDGRETDPLRELSEELVEEYRVLPPFGINDLQYKRLYTVEAWRTTQRQGAEGYYTYNLHEIYDVRFQRPDLVDRLFTVQGAMLQWVTPAMIRQGQTNEGTRIEADILLKGAKTL